MKNKTNLFFIIFMIIFIAGSFFWYTRFRNVSKEGLITQSGKESVLGKDFISIANKLKTIQIDGDFLESKEFKSLKDLTIVVETPEEIGRENPFLPIGQNN